VSISGLAIFRGDRFNLLYNTRKGGL